MLFTCSNIGVRLEKEIKKCAGAPARPITKVSEETNPSLTSRWPEFLLRCFTHPRPAGSPRSRSIFVAGCSVALLLCSLFTAIPCYSQSVKERIQAHLERERATKQEINSDQFETGFKPEILAAEDYIIEDVKEDLGKGKVLRKLLYPDGSLKHVRRYRDNNVPEGLWEWYAEDGTRYMILNFNDGKVVDEFNRPVTGIEKYYYKTGELMAEVYYFGGLRQGAATVYHKDGSVYQEIEYHYGKKNGTTKTLQQGGKIKIFEVYENDKIMSKIIVNEEGIPVYSSNFDQERNEIVHFGTKNEYFPNGTLKSSKPYNKNGRLHGRVVEYDDTGAIIVDALYKHGRLLKENEN